MQNSTSTMIAMFIAAILLFIAPLITLTDRNDNVTQENVKLIVEEFVTDIRNTGELTRTKYQDFSNRLYSAGGNTYEIEIEIKYLDENPGKKTMQANYTKIGENVYYSEYTTQILKKIGIKVDNDSVSEEDDSILLKEGDMVYVEVRNENSTTAQTLKSSFLSFSNAGEYVISANSAGMVTVNGDGIIAERVTEEEMAQYEYKVTYNANGGEGGLASQGKSYGEDINITDTKPTKTGYNFLGWSTNPSSQEVTYKPGDIFSINGNVTLYAVWEIKTFKIFYYANGGIETLETQTKTYGIDLKLHPDRLTRTGYTFLGWSTNSEDKTASYLPGSMFTINEDTALYAIWKPHKYTITYDANGGTNPPDPDIKTHDIILTLTSVQPIRTGYTFLGWNTNPSATTVKYLPGATFTTEGNTTLYAVWKINTFIVKYDANGGTGEPEQQVKTYGKDLTLSLIEPTKTGYTFLGWSTDQKAEKEEYVAGGIFKINADTTLYAVWEINTYIIKYDANRGTDAPAQQIKTYGKDLVLQSTEPTREGYTFLGWHTSSTAIEQIYEPGDTFTDNKDTTLYAVWRINTYLIRYDPNGGKDAPGDQTKTYGEDLTLSSTIPTRDGYTFLGWSSDKTAVKAEYTAGGKFTVNNDTKLYAIWDLNKYTVTYYANGGTGAPKSDTKIHGIELTLSSTKPTKTGYTFLGWSTNKNATEPTYLAEDAFTINKDTDLYAIWKINTYEIKYNANKGTGAPSSDTKTYGVDLTLSSSIPTRDGYTFLGWSTSSTASKATYQPEATFTTDENTTLFAVWELNKYTIKYDPKGGTGAPASDTKTHDVDLTLSSTKPTKTGCTFSGWSTSSLANEVTHKAGGTFSINANTTLYAVWSANTYTIKYNANEGTGAPDDDTYTYDTVGVINLSSKIPTRDGYTFLGWSTDASAKEKSYSPGQAWNKSNASNTTLYAVWRLNTYTITYDANGGSGEPGADTKTHGVELKLSTTEPKKSGYTFLGWSESSTAKEATYEAGETFTDNKDTKLYAVWQVAEYIVTYNKNGGTGENASVSRNIGTSLTLEKATKFSAPSGKHFSHWNTESDGTGKSYDAEDEYTDSESIILYAIWVAHTDSCYDITYHAHTSSCNNHTHSGNTTNGGACYQTPSTVKCGSARTETGPCSWWWDDANNRCIRCHSTSKTTTHTDHYCNSCGSSCDEDGHYKTAYSLSCTLKQGYQCGKTTNTEETRTLKCGGNP